MSRRATVIVLTLSVLMWAAGVSVFLFAESWWRLFGVVLFSFAIPLFIWAGRALRGTRGTEPSQ